ncbi:hypothetical protein ELF58_25225 [Salmonella enterica]|nr:hypothetical protein [Salmonella enterica]
MALELRRLNGAAGRPIRDTRPLLQGTTCAIPCRSGLAPRTRAKGPRFACISLPAALRRYPGCSPG